VNITLKSLVFYDKFNLGTLTERGGYVQLSPNQGTVFCKKKLNNIFNKNS